MSAIQHQLQNFDSGKDVSLVVPKKFTNLPLASIVLPQNQPRRYFDSQKLKELTSSVCQHGVLEPLLVRRLSDSKELYSLVAGERRYRAAKSAGLMEVPVAICHFSDSEALTISLIENLQREDLNPVEETYGILTLLSLRLNKSVEEVTSLLYRMRNEANGRVSQNVLTNPCGQTIQSVFDSLGLLSWESFVTSRLPLLKLPEDLIEALRQGKIAYTKAKALASVKNNEQRQALTEAAIEQNLSLSEIKKRIKMGHRLPSPTLTLKQKVQATLKRLVNSRLWEDPEKKQQVEQLLSQLEALLSR